MQCGPCMHSHDAERLGGNAVSRYSHRLFCKGVLLLVHSKPVVLLTTYTMYIHMVPCGSIRKWAYLAGLQLQPLCATPASLPMLQWCLAGVQAVTWFLANATWFSMILDSCTSALSTDRPIVAFAHNNSDSSSSNCNCNNFQQREWHAKALA